MAWKHLICRQPAWVLLTLLLVLVIQEGHFTIWHNFVVEVVVSRCFVIVQGGVSVSDEKSRHASIGAGDVKRSIATPLH